MPDYETRTYLEVRKYYQDAVRQDLDVQCHLCGRQITSDSNCKGGAVQIDHVVAVADGGSLTDRNNMRPAHALCNQRKGQRTMIRRTQGKHARRKRHRSPNFPRQGAVDS